MSTAKEILDHVEQFCNELERFAGQVKKIPIIPAELPVLN
jgi:hypothetical protein